MGKVSRPPLRWRVGLAYSLLIILAISSLGIFLSHLFYQNYTEYIRSRLLAESAVMAAQIGDIPNDASGDILTNTIIQSYAELLDARITYIVPDGKVVVDTASQLALEENHAQRPEVKEALQGNRFSDIRYSDTLQTDMLYAAAPVEQDGQIIGAVRLAISLEKINQNMAAVRRALIIGTILAILVGIALAIILSAYTTRPLQDLTESVIAISRGEKKPSVISYENDEIGRLDRAFNEMAVKLNAQIDELQNERGKLSAVLANMTDGILIIDSDSTVQLINPAAQRLFHISESKAIGNSLIEVVRQHELVELWRICQLTGEQQIQMLEIGHERLFLQGIATPLGLAMPGGILLVFQDLTRIRRLENIRRDFISNVSHELRTPLASLKAITETMLEGAIDDPPAARRFMLRMDGEVDNLTQMVMELLELTRIESGRVPLERVRISPMDMLHPAMERMLLQAERAGLIIKLDCCPEDLPFIYVDPKRMEQVLVNLLHNAIKFTPPGGEIVLGAYQENAMVIFFVRDTGVGISMQDLPRIFERFYKADRSRSGGGTGLGLSISRHLVEAHGGRIWADSAPGKGSTLFFSIPRINGKN